MNFTHSKPFTLLRSIKKLVKNFKILAYDYGQFKTILSGNCVDQNNSEIPWYTYPAYEFLKSLDIKDRKVLEFGSGNSSIFWSKKAKSVVSVEHDKAWHDKISKELRENQKLILCESLENYEKPKQLLDEKFEIIIIDAIKRYECAANVKKYLNINYDKGCMVILDNSDWYKNTAKLLRKELDFIEIDFHGFGPINSYTWTTSIFLSRNFKYETEKVFQPDFSAGAIKSNYD